MFNLRRLSDNHVTGAGPSTSRMAPPPPPHDGPADETYHGFDLNAGRSWIYPTNYPEREYQFREEL